MSKVDRLTVGLAILMLLVMALFAATEPNGTLIKGVEVAGK